MRLNISYKIEMSKELQGVFKNLKANVARSIKGGALRAGAKVIRTEAKSKVVKDSGALAGSVRHGINNDRKTREIYGFVRSGGKKYRTMSVGGRKEKSLRSDPYYAHFVEFGTKGGYDIPHTRDRILSKTKLPDGRKLKVTGKKNPKTRMRIGKKWRTGPFRNNKGMTARPFMRPALDGKRNDALKAMGDYIKSKLPDAIIGTMPFSIMDDDR